MGAILQRLSRLKDVVLSSPQDGDVLSYDSGTGKWVNEAASGGSVAASAVTFTPAGTVASTNVQAAIEEVSGDVGSQTTDLANHIADSSAAHAASAVSASSATLSGTGTDVQAVLEELDNLLDDHSSRHENGGADEISIAGLDGVSTELAAHLADSSDAHDASAISVVSTTLVGTGTDAQAVFEELDNAIVAAETATANHLADSSAAHAASAISADSTTLVGTGTDVQAVLEELDNGIADHLADTSDAHDASAISVLDTGAFYTATDVEGVLAEIHEISLRYDRVWALILPQLTSSIRTLGTGIAFSNGTATTVTATSAFPPLTNMLGATSVNTAANIGIAAPMQLTRGAASDVYAGWFVHSRVRYPDASYNNTGASTGTRLRGLALYGGTSGTLFGTDRGGTQDLAGFFRDHVNGGATDTNWQFVTCDNTTTTTADTGMAFTIGNIYEFFMTCAAGGTSIAWRINNITAATTVSGTATLTLPRAATMCNLVFGGLTVDAVGRNYQMQRIYARAAQG